MKNSRSLPVQLALILITIGALVSSCASLLQDQNSALSNTDPQAKSDTTYVIRLTDSNFAEKVEQGPGLKIVYFSRQLNTSYSDYGLLFDDIVKYYEGEVMIGQLNTQFNRFTLAKHGRFVRLGRFPSFVFYRDGVAVYWTYREMSEPYLLATIDRLMVESEQQESAAGEQ